MAVANPKRIEGPDLPVKECADVEGWLIALFVSLTDTPVLSPRARRMVATEPHVAPNGPLDCYYLAVEALGSDSADLKALLTWARAKARRRIKRHRRLRSMRDVPGGTVTDHCNEFGINRRTFDRRRERACKSVAKAWNSREFAKAPL